ncbi:proteinase-activated receptor 3-like [Seriola lalandi dorsalis]|uniref:Coagulation factor II thrombin receptor like 2 n=1 Tax=Seriola lalandi dorsalis TaxID=1841481 RepID=A0A3B4XQ81_SERLL|nr:proteinase-activated receptor 3-like [Seriola lalandi dorsalis]XP_056258697.1 proteinase-activated receptor 3 [Seriola aureovittata]
MGKLNLFFLLLVLGVSGALQEEDNNRKRPADVFPVPRVFKGDPVYPTFSSNGTQAPNSSHYRPELRLLSNGTAEYLDGPLSTRVIPIIYILVVTVGVPANLAILCSLASKIRKVSSAILYCSLAVSDLFLLFSLFFKAHYHLHGNHWVLGEAACRVVTACFYGNLYCSAQTLACISIKRYLAVVHPFMYKTLPKRMCTAWVTLALWLVFGAAIVPELLIQQSYRLQGQERITCHDVLPLDHDSHMFLLYYNLILTLFGLLVPLVVTVVCYARIICELNQSHLDWAMYIKASSLVFVIFLVCFLPAGILHFLHYVQLFVDGTESLYMYFKVAVCLCCLHSCLDPFLFLLMSKSAGSRKYLRGFKGISLSLSV